MATENEMLGPEVPEPDREQRSRILQDCGQALEEIYQSLQTLLNTTNHVERDALDREKLKECRQEIELLYWQLRSLQNMDLA